MTFDVEGQKCRASYTGGDKLSSRALGIVAYCECEAVLYFTLNVFFVVVVVVTH